MQLADVIMHGLVLGVGVPAMWKNRTAGALVVAWSLGQALWLLTGDNLPLRAYWLIDLAVILAIYTKPDAEDCWPYNGLGQQFMALWRERTMWDRIVVGIFLIMWVFYLVPVGDTPRFWALWWLAAAQFLAAGGEALSIFLKERRAKAPAKETPPGALRLGLAVHG